MSVSIVQTFVVDLYCWYNICFFLSIQMPAVLSTLQRSVHGILLGKVIRPDWLTHGVPSSSLIDSFGLKLPNEIAHTSMKLKSLATDGAYLYLFTSKGLLKLGSGYGGTIKGHVAAWKPDFYPNDNGTLVFCDVSMNHENLSSTKDINFFF